MLDIVELYKQGASIEALAEQSGKSQQSVRTTLAIAGVYKRKSYKPKYSDRVLRKDQIVEQIEAACGFTAGFLEGLDKANRTTLLALLEHITKKPPQ